MGLMTSIETDLPGGFSRHSFIRGAAITTLVVLAEIFKPWELFALPAEINQYYPDLKGEKLHSNGEFYTTRTNTKWFNFTGRNFDQNFAKATFEFFENLAKSQKILEYKWGGQSIPIAIAEKPRTQRVFFVIPEKAPIPTWPDAAKDASTTGVFENSPYISFGRVHDREEGLPPSLVFTTIETAFNQAFSVESCQSSILVSSLSTEMANLAQEIFCNSYGSAFTLKQMGTSYDKYSIWAKDVLIRKNPQSPSYPLYILSEQEYGEIPTIGLILG